MQIVKAAGALGAFCRDVCVADAIESDELLQALERALLEHQVLFIPDQDISPTELEQFAARLGPVLGHPAYTTVPGTADVQILESTAERPSKIEVWHSDMTFRPAPPAYTVLHAQIVPEFGGDTLWASAQAAYDALSAPMQAFLGELTCVHDFRHGFRESLAEPGGAERLADALAANPPVEHPLVRTHPRSGRKSIYVNRLFTTRIKELSEHESDRLLRFLCELVVREEFTVRLAWRRGTVAIWDNCATQHKPINDFFPQQRKMHRVTIAGERPI